MAKCELYHGPANNINCSPLLPPAFRSVWYKVVRCHEQKQKQRSKRRFYNQYQNELCLETRGPIHQSARYSPIARMGLCLPMKPWYDVIYSVTTGMAYIRKSLLRRRHCNFSRIINRLSVQSQCVVWNSLTSREKKIKPLPKAPLWSVSTMSNE